MSDSILIKDISIHIPTLIAHAIDAMQFAYTPYSKFDVGAVVVDTTGKEYHGANIENASYGLSCCAERTAIFSAVAHGMRTLVALCVVGNTTLPISPCGACRQVIREFAEKETIIILSNLEKKIQLLNIEKLLPYSFGKEHL